MADTRLCLEPRADRADTRPRGSLPSPAVLVPTSSMRHTAGCAPKYMKIRLGKYLCFKIKVVQYVLVDMVEGPADMLCAVCKLTGG